MTESDSIASHLLNDIQVLVMVVLMECCGNFCPVLMHVNPIESIWLSIQKESFICICVIIAESYCLLPPVYFSSILSQYDNSLIQKRIFHSIPQVRIVYCSGHYHLVPFRYFVADQATKLFPPVV